MTDHRGDPSLRTGQAVIDHVERNSRSLLEMSDHGKGETDVAIWEQGDDAFTTPAMERYFLAIALDGMAIADLDFAACTGPRQAVISPGSLCFVPAGNACALEIDGRLRAAHIIFSDGLFATELADAADRFGGPGDVLGFVAERHPGIAAGCFDLARHIEQQSGDALRRSSLEHALARSLVRHVYPFSGAASSGEVLSNVQMKQAVDYIEDRVFESFDLADMAAFVSATVPVLVRSFEAEVGTSPALFRMERQVDHIRTWLAVTEDAQPWDLARTAGFASVPEMDRAFLAVMGIGFENYRHRAFC